MIPYTNGQRAIETTGQQMPTINMQRRSDGGLQQELVLLQIWAPWGPTGCSDAMGPEGA